MLREIVLDTETTGIDHGKGDRVIEIGCVELVNHFPTGRCFHAYINPEWPVSRRARSPSTASADEFLADKPVFRRDRRRVRGLHRRRPARHPQRRLRRRLSQCGIRPARPPRRHAERCASTPWRSPGASIRARPTTSTRSARATASTIRRRTKHGALLDAEILAEVYIELIGGKQTGLDLTSARAGAIPAFQTGAAASREMRPRPFLSRLTDAERAAHAAFVATLGPIALGPILAPAD